MTDSAPHPFTIANYRYLWFARLSSMFALYAMMLILGWQAYNLAREDMGVGASAGILGLLGLLQFIPLFILTPLVGWVADHWDRRWIARIVLAGQAAIALVLGLLTMTGQISLWSIYIIAVLLGICRAFLGPAITSLAPNLVPKASLPRAIALSTIAWQVGVIAGPGMAGPLYKVDPSLPYFVCTALYSLAVLAMFMIGPVTRSEIDRTKGPVKQVLDGLSYVWTNKLVLGAITLDLLVMFLAGATAMIPVFAKDILNAGEIGLSLLAAAPAVGAVIVAGIFSFVPLSKNVGNSMLVAMAVFGIGTIGFGLSTSLYLSMACLALCGAADMFGVYIRSSLIQLHTPDEKRGRVNAVSQMTISASNELGDALSGGLAVLVGPIAAIVGGGAAAIAVTGLWSRLFPQLGAAKTFDPPEELQTEMIKTRKVTD
ncbi:MFS transporter [Parasphingorhabdus sp.]|jgi:MFS family permease|uniref:MFS transporter n=1 Tax=Parasphingorhabdus sp. TaxID=2709688 RepID=UPI003D2C6A82